MTKRETIAAIIKTTGWKKNELAQKLKVSPGLIQRASNPGTTSEGQWELDLKLIPLCIELGLIKDFGKERILDSSAVNKSRTERLLEIADDKRRKNKNPRMVKNDDG